jgi:leucyl aminopeptidase
MKINFASKAQIQVPTVLVLTEEEVKKSSLKAVKFAKENFGFEGKINQAALVSENILIGAGASEKLSDLVLQKIGSSIVAFLNGSKIKQANVYFESKSLAQVAFGGLLQSYRFNKYFENKKKNKELRVESITFVTSDLSKIQKDFAPLKTLAENIFFTRDLVSEPSNVLNPESYADICKTLKKEGLEVQIFGEAEMEKLGMNALLGVGQGSYKESKMVIIKWNGGKKGEAPLAFVGKGVTFDTGGISIKPSANMEDMKTDMAGSAVVVGLLRNLAQRKAKVNVVGAIGLVENMPSGNAQRPGDVVRSMSGQTIEVINTDAEGRLVLSDVLHYTNTKFKPKFIVDLATLTGAIIVALADVYAGLFSNDDELSKQLESCGAKVGERVWRLPIGEEYDEMINSDIADMKNVGSGRGAGSITAAQFLHRFVGKTKWAHLDIAGVAWRGKGDAMAVKGASGFGVRLLDELVKIYEK